jgi:hypothetical protein
MRPNRPTLTHTDTHQNTHTHTHRAHTAHTHTHTHTYTHTAQHSTAQHSTAQHSTAQHSTAQRSTACVLRHTQSTHSTHTHTHTAQHSTACVLRHGTGARSLVSASMSGVTSARGQACPHNHRALRSGWQSKHTTHVMRGAVPRSTRRVLCSSRPDGRGERTSTQHATPRTLRQVLLRAGRPHTLRPVPPPTANEQGR